MNGRALALVPVDSTVCTWCLGVNGTHAPSCYVGRALARLAARAPEPEPARKSLLQEYREHREALDRR